MRRNKPREIYCTTFCNFGHDIHSGRPIGHECYILDPKKLQRERDGDDTVYHEDAKLYPLRVVKGRS